MSLHPTSPEDVWALLRASSSSLGKTLTCTLQSLHLWAVCDVAGDIYSPTTYFSVISLQEAGKAKSVGN